MKINPLTILALLFALSFSGRAFGLASAALSGVEKAVPETKTEPAEDSGRKHHDNDGKQEHDADDHDTKSSEAASHQSENLPASNGSEEMVASSDLLKSIRERSKMLGAKETAIENRVRVLEIVEMRVDEKLKLLKDANAELSQLVTYANEASQKDISHLASMYEQMKPTKAGEIFDQMEAGIAAGFLTEMNSENAALVLTNMSTEKAYAASMKIASRNAAAHQR